MNYMEGIVEVYSVEKRPNFQHIEFHRKKILRKNMKRGHDEACPYSKCLEARDIRTGVQGQPPKHREFRVNPGNMRPHHKQQAEI